MGHHQVYQFMKNVNPRIIGEKWIERIFEGLRAENFPNLYIQESQQSPRRENTKRSTLRHNKTIKRQGDDLESSMREVNRHV